MGSVAMSINHVSAATKLRDFLENSKDILVCPGVYDGFSARIALSVGFDALYMV
jgi:methylisocitrate lyase